MSDVESETKVMDWNEFTANYMSGYRKNGNITCLLPSDEVYDNWSSIDENNKKKITHHMKTFVFWFPIVLQRDESSSTACWAMQIGLIDINEDLSLNNIYKIEIVEAILRALENGTVKKEQTKHVIWISNMFDMHSPEVLEDAVHWLERTGEPFIRRRVMELGHVGTCLIALHFIFHEFSRYIEAVGTDFPKMMKGMKALPSTFEREKSEEMKTKGNGHFQRGQYDDAVRFYSKAIRYLPDNHVVYGNRALCFIRCGKYLKAVGDGKRAILINPLWAKGHYRYCEALFLLGEVKMAIEANVSARSLCKEEQGGLKDLEQQHQKFIIDTSDPKVERPKKPQNERQESPNGACLKESQPPTGKTEKKVDPPTNAAPQKASHNPTDKKPGKTKNTAQGDGSTKDSKPSKGDAPLKNGKGDLSMTPKKKPMDKNPSKAEVRQNQKADTNKAAMCKELRTVVQDAHTALVDQRSRNAERAFSQALALLGTTTPKDFGLTTVDVMMLLYGRAAALTEIGQPEELGEAQRLLEKIRSCGERTVQCLVFFAMGRIYVRENRFAVALEQFLNSMQMVKNQIVPGKLTWPLTREVVKETLPDYFKEILEKAIEKCKFPPLPDAMCRHEKRDGHVKAEIYFTDPDFKGFIQLCCCQSCVIEYHMTCWKILKASSFSEKSEKDLLQEPCLTPDCTGKVCSIKLFGSTGLLKCKFEINIPKPQIPKKPKVNQISTSLKKLKSKEHRLKMKHNKQSFQDNPTMDNEILQEKEDSATQIQQKTWLQFRDRVLLQISQNTELLSGEKGLLVSDLTGGLKPWLELDSLRGNQLALKILGWEKEQLHSVAQVVELVLERKNRIWARVLIQLLSTSADINPKLYNWACQLNNAGLNAAKCFIERHSEHLEQLDMAALLRFDLLQEVIINELGTRTEPFSSLTLTEHLKRAPASDARLFIWTLEEHRDDYVSCHTILDEYFDMMDVNSSVIKRSDDQTNSPLKSRGRRKKGKNVHFIPREVLSRDELEQDFFEDRSLSFLDPDDPFSVPSHLREQVAEFEEQYNNTRHSSHYKMFLDNNPDPTKESLYDYFAQILEEHGPLLAEDPILVGEVKNFPHLALTKIEEAGGFEPFLLDSLRFIKMGTCIGLAKHAVSLQQYRYGASLDDLDELDEIENPGSYSSAPNCFDPSVSYLYSFPSPQNDFYPVAQTSYAFSSAHPPVLSNIASGVTSAGDGPFSHLALGDGPQQGPYCLRNDNSEPDLYTSYVDGEDSGGASSPNSVASVTPDERILKKHAAAQTGQDDVRSVAVNTELHERFEICPGDIIKKQKSIEELKNQLDKMADGCDKHKEELAAIEEDIKNINVVIQVTNKELLLFQQKLEEEVKKDQKEKKSNQEVLKSLKVEIEVLVLEQGSLSRNIREKKSNHEAKLRDFIELSNRSDTERFSLEEELRRSQASLSSAKRRSQTAQLSIVDSRRDHGLYGLYRELANAKALLTKLDEAVHKCPNPELEKSRSAERAGVQEVEKRISVAETQYQEQMDQVRNGVRVSALPSVNIERRPEAELMRIRDPNQGGRDITEELNARMSAVHIGATPNLRQSSPVQMQHTPRARTPELQINTVFNTAMEHLTNMFPDLSRKELKGFMGAVRSSSGGSLSSMALQDLVSGVAQLILDNQEKQCSARSNRVGRGSPAPCDTVPPSSSPWQKVEPPKAPHSNALNLDEPCIICHDDMSPEDLTVLNCKHGFHKKCIELWLKEKNTCPTCRNQAKLEDFPVLPGRRRQAP